MEIYEKRIKKTNIFFLVLIILYLVFSFGIQLFVQSTVASSCLIDLFILGIGMIFLFCWRVNIKDYLRLKKIDFVSILFCILYGICLVPITTVINAVSMLFVKNMVSSSVFEIVEQSFGISFIVIAIVPAIVEETLFRGIIYRGYRQARPIRGILYSAFLFGAMHVNFNQFFYAFFLGIAFGFLVEVTDSLIPSMIVHCLFNGQSVCLAYLLKAVNQFMNNSGLNTTAGVASTSNLTSNTIFSTVLFYTPFAIGGAVFAIALLLALAKRNHRYDYMMSWFGKEYEEERKELPKPRIISISLALAVLLCFAVCIVVELN